MTAPAPRPPLLVRVRLRLRWARRRARYAAARHLRRLTALLDPPPEAVERARVADLTLLGVTRPPHRSTLSDREAARARHPSVNADTAAALVEWHDLDEADRTRVRLLRPVPPRPGEDNPR